MEPGSLSALRRSLAWTDKPNGADGSSTCEALPEQFSRGQTAVGLEPELELRCNIVENGSERWESRSVRH